MYVGLSLACLGQKEEAIREGVEGLEGRREAKDAFNVRFHLYLLARTLVLVDGPEKAIDQLQALTRTPFFVSPARVGIDPNFALLRKNPRFQKLVARGK